MAVPRVAAAAGNRGPRAARAGHVRTLGVGYAEAALGPRYSGPAAEGALRAQRPAGQPRGHDGPADGRGRPIHLAMHFGSVDLSALYGARVGELPVTGPMEFVTSPLARAYFDHVRFELGVTIVPVNDAAESSSRRSSAARRWASWPIATSSGAASRWSSSASHPAAHRAGRPLGADRRSHLPAGHRPNRPGKWLGHTVRIRPSPGLVRREATRSIIERRPAPSSASSRERRNNGRHCSSRSGATREQR